MQKEKRKFFIEKNEIISEIQAIIGEYRCEIGRLKKEKDAVVSKYIFEVEKEKLKKIRSIINSD